MFPRELRKYLHQVHLVSGIGVVQSLWLHSLCAWYSSSHGDLWILQRRCRYQPDISRWLLRHSCHGRVSLWVYLSRFLRDNYPPSHKLGRISCILPRICSRESMILVIKISGHDAALRGFELAKDILPATWLMSLCSPALKKSAERDCHRQSAAEETVLWNMRVVLEKMSGLECWTENDIVTLEQNLHLINVEVNCNISLRPVNHGQSCRWL